MHGLFGLALFMAFSACETTTTNGTESAASRAEFRSEIPPEVYDFAFAAAVAEQISDECSSIKFNRSAAESQMKVLDEDLKTKGYLESDLRYLARNIPRKRAQDDLIAYIQKSGVVIGESSTFCAAGRREIANSTRIGALLKG
jgi:enoyl-[acyl-carrier-protein] reductase (NADH)